MPLYKGETGGEGFTNNLTLTSPEPHLLSHCEEKENFGQSLYGLNERDFATKPTKTFSQGWELFFLSIVAKMGIKDLFVSEGKPLRKFHTIHRKEKLKME